MKRWAALTVLFYVVVLAVLAAPLLLASFCTWWPAAHAQTSLSFQEAFEIYEQWGFWVWLAVMGLGQALLLVAPVGLAERRPRPRRPLFIPVLTAAFFLALLLLGAVVAVLCVIFKDDAFEMFPQIAKMAQADAAHHLVTSQVWKATAAAAGSGTAEGLFGVALALAVCWLVWAVVFCSFARSDDPAALVKRTTRWLLRGSVLDLLVAVPSHMIVRQRNDCCAPAGTFLGIATGVSIMLLCFGPGVFFLFVERFDRLRPKRAVPQAEDVPAARLNS